MWLLFEFVSLGIGVFIKCCVTDAICCYFDSLECCSIHEGAVNASRLIFSDFNTNLNQEMSNKLVP